MRVQLTSCLAWVAWLTLMGCAAEVGEARGVAYVGVQLLCVLRDLEPPGELPPEDPDALAWRIEPLWAGPVVTTRGGPR